MFRIGQKVVCVDDQNTNYGNARELCCGQVYTVSWAGLHEDADYGEETAPCVRLYEVKRWAGDDLPFYASRFRPIVERKTDISIFEEILRRESVPDECAPAEYGVDWGASA